MAEDKGAIASTAGESSKVSNVTRKSSIDETREKIVETRKKQIRSTWETRSALLFELFYMTKTQDDPSIIEKESLDALVADQFSKFIGSHRLPVSPPKDLDIPGLSKQSDVVQSDTKPITPPQSAPQERMVTRRVSGAIRPRTVDQILGNEKSPTTLRTEKLHPRPQISLTAPRNIPTAPTFAENQKVSSKPGKRRRKISTLDLYRWQLEHQAQPLYEFLRKAHKVVISKDWKLARDEMITIKALQKLEKLRMSKAEPYSFRQPEKQRTCPRPKAHWDFLLDELKWMQTDFKEERKWKIATAWLLANWVMEWHAAEDKSTVCVKVKPREADIEIRDTEMSSIAEVPMEGIDESPISPLSQPERHEEDENVSVIKQEDTLGDDAQFKSPSVLNVNASNSDGTQADAETQVTAEKTSPLLIESCRSKVLTIDPLLTVFTIDSLFPGTQEPVTLVDIFSDLPSYEVNAKISDLYVDEIEDMKITPVSKWMSRKVIVASSELPRKRRRIGTFEDDDDEAQPLPIPRSRFDPTENKEAICSLFAPKRTRDGLLSMRPPAMPPNLANRPMMQWTNEEDELLLRIVKQCQHNWEMVADMFNSNRAASKNAEPRTAWDCYEHWVKKDNNSQMATQGMAGPLHQHAVAAIQAMAAQHSTLKLDPKKTGMMGIVRPLKFKSEAQRKKQRTASMFDAMKRTARKREAAARQQQQQQANPATTSSRKATADANATTNRIPTPADLSKQKAERDRALAQQIIEQRQAAAAAFALQQGNRQNPLNRLPAAAVAAAAAAAGQLSANHPLVQARRAAAVANAAAANRVNSAAVAAAATASTSTAAKIPNAVSSPVPAAAVGNASTNSPNNVGRVASVPPASNSSVATAAAAAAAAALANTSANAGNANAVGAAGSTVSATSSPRLPAGLTREQMALLIARHQQLRQQAANGGQANSATNAAVLQNYATALANLTAANLVKTTSNNTGATTDASVANGGTTGISNTNASNPTPASGTNTNATLSASAALSAALTPTITALSNQIVLQNPNLTPQQVAAVAQARFQQLYAAQLRAQQQRQLQQQQQQQQPK